MKKRILSILLAAIMVVSLLPTVAFAGAGTGDGEWFGYCTEDSQFADSIGTGSESSLTFAIRIPAASLPNQKVLSKVSFYTCNSNTHHVRIYSTDPSEDPGTAAPDYEQEVTVSNPNKWEDVVLTTPYVVDKTKDLWIGIENTALYPASCAENAENILTNNDCCMMYYEETWSPITDLGLSEIHPWMIRGYFETVTPVSGGKTLPYSFGFETDPFSLTNGWTTIDADTDGYDWETDTDELRDNTQINGVNGSHCVVSKSFNNYSSPRNPDNWLFSPAITIPAGGATVSWYEQSQDPNWQDYYTVYVGETAVAQEYNVSTAQNGMKVLYEYHEAASSWTKISVELSAENYGGKTVYIAFRHQSEDGYMLKIDNFAVRAAASAHTHAFTYTANNGKITATCVDGCDDCYNTSPLTLTLTAPTSLVYDGSVKAFTFADGETAAWTGAGLELPTIYYHIKQSGQSTYGPLLGTLIDAGDYMAQITVDGEHAQVYFSIVAPHTHNLVKVTGQAATETAAGFKDYYECKDSDDACHKYFEDATGLIPIENLDAWKLSTGSGYIAPLATHSGGSTPTVTVPVSGNENSVKVSATVSGSTATIKDIKDADLAKVTGGESVEIDLTGLKKDVETAKLPTETVEKIGEQAGMSVKLTTATVSFDKTATQEISDQAKGNTVELVVDDIKEVSLNAVQKEAVGKLDTAILIDAYLVSGGTKLCTENRGGFNGGKATVILPYELKSGSTAANYSVYYVAEDGTLEKLNAKYDTKLGAFVFDIEHFSNYVVAYDENAMLFVDVAEGSFYYDAVLWAATNGITSGTDAVHFSPNAPVTRAQVATFLWRAAGKPVVNYAMNMSDVASGAYYTEAVRWALAEGITKDTDAAHFSPNATCTRGQIVSFLYRYAKAAASETTNPFTDVATDAYYYDAVLWALANGITGGKTATTFAPTDICNRAQVVTFLYRYMG